MSVVDGKLALTIERSTLLEGIDRAAGPRHEFTIETLADSIHKSFCEPKGYRGLASEIHRRQHIEIAKTIIENDRSVTRG